MARTTVEDVKDIAEFTSVTDSELHGFIQDANIIVDDRLKGNASDACPSCDREFDSELGVKLHHAKTHNESLTFSEAVCEFCGEGFEYKESRSKGRFCSLQCKGGYFSWFSGPIEGFEHGKRLPGKEHPNWKGGLVELVCEFCEEKYDKRRDEVEKSRFCSENCKDSWTSENITGKDHPNYKEGEGWLTCKWCEEDFRVAPSQTEGKYFCGDDCYASWLSENNTGENHPRWNPNYEDDYGPAWTHSLRSDIRKRDDHECQVCGVQQEELSERLDVHHITPFHEFGADDHEKANDPDNLISLCRSCHMEVEGEGDIFGE